MMEHYDNEKNPTNKNMLDNILRQYEMYINDSLYMENMAK